MPLVRTRESTAARGLAEAVLLERLPVDLGRSDSDRSVLMDGRGRLGMVPIYSLGSEAILERRLDRAWRAAWRYIWVHPAAGAGAQVTIRSRKRGDPQLIRYRWSADVVRLAEQLDDSQNSVADVPTDYRVRILKLAPLKMEAIWLCGRESDVLKGISPLLDGPEFLEEAIRRVAEMQ